MSRWLGIAILSVTCIGVINAQDAPEHGIISKQPAAKWQEGLVTGNGRMGANVLCVPGQERIIVTHEHLFNPKTRHVASFHVAFGLFLAMKDLPEYKNYSRSVDFESGEVTVRFSDTRGDYRRRLFVSRSDNVIVYSITAPEGDKAGKLNCSLTLAGGQVDLKDNEGWISYRHTYTGFGNGFEGLARVICKGGKAEVVFRKSKNGPQSVAVSDADELLLLVRVQPVPDMEKSKIDDMKSSLGAIDSDYDKLLSRHVKIHGEMFNRVSMDLEGGKDRMLPVETLLDRARKGDVSNALLEKLYEAGRYVVICSSGQWPPNLQGIWCGSWKPPWASDYHMDANLQCAIASMAGGNLPECLHAYFDYIEYLLPDWRKNAQKVYGARGIMASIASTTHGRLARYRTWTAGAGWQAQPFYDYYLHTGDREFLAKRAVPIMKEVALFYEDFLKGKEGPDGKYRYTPSYSPESNAPDEEGVVNATMDIAVARDTLNNLVSACEELGIEEDGVARWKAMLKKLPDYMYDENGVLKEWLVGENKYASAHRHVSHLYPLFQGFEADPFKTPRLFEGIKKAADLKMKSMTKPTGFGLGELAVTYARLGEGETVYRILSQLATDFHFRNLVSHVGPKWHYIFNVDANGIVPQAIQDMLVFSRPGRITLISAVSRKLPRGTVKGIVCRGQVRVERLQWNLESGRIDALLKSGKTQAITLRLPGDIKAIKVTPDAEVELSQYGNSCRKLVLPAGKSVRVEVELINN